MYRKIGKVIGEMGNVFKNIIIRISYDFWFVVFYSVYIDVWNWNKNYNNFFFKKKKKIYMKEEG